MTPRLTPAKITMTPAAASLRTIEVALDPSTESPLDLTVFISCYNEKAYIIDTIDTVRAALAEIGRFSYEIIIIDDGSRDCSPELIEDYIRTHTEECILFRRNNVNLGWAQNYLDAAFLGKGKYYRVVCGDNSEPKETMVSVFGEIGTVDILVPYYATSEGRGAYRLLVSRVYTTFVNIVSGFRLHYYNDLAVHLRHNVMRWHSNTRGFGFQADILCLVLEQGFTYKQIAVKTIERKKGASTAITFKNLLSVTHTLFDILIRRIANSVHDRGKQRHAAPLEKPDRVDSR